MRQLLEVVVVMAHIARMRNVDPETTQLLDCVLMAMLSVDLHACLQGLITINPNQNITLFLI